MTIDAAAAATILLRRRRMRASLAAFAQSIQIPGAPVGGDDSELFAPVGTGMAKHHVLICNAIQACLETDYGRLILMMPPGAAKSTYASAIAPAWAMGRWPGYQCILTSYGTELAKKHGRKARAICKQAVYQDAFGHGIDRSRSAAELWGITNGSEYMAGGILSGITGNRADAVFGDDLIAGAQEADSPATRQATWEAWEMDVMTRLKPRGSVVLLGTRWHPLDPIGMLLPADYDGRSGPVQCNDGMVWQVLCIPAEAEREDDPLGRQAGEMLWPEWFPPEHWITPRKNARNWAALYQQRPSIEGGNRFKAEWVQWYEPGAEPSALNVYGFSDWGAPSETSIDPDFTEHGVFGLCPDRHVWALDWYYGQESTLTGQKENFRLAQTWRPLQWTNEKGPIYNAIAPTLKEKFKQAGQYMRWDALPSIGNKVARAESFYAIAEEGRLHLPNLPWAHRLVRQLCDFPQVPHDDAVDVCSLAGRKLANMPHAWLPEVPRDASLKPFSVEWLFHEAKPKPTKDVVID
jgi:predicted phage terminase large subunit-like protein